VKNPAALYKLQEIDTFRRKVHRRLLSLKKVLNQDEALQAARQEVTELEATLKQWSAAQLEAELAVKSLDARIQETEQRLMSGKVRNPKELESLQASVIALRHQKEATEDKGVEAMLKVEEISAQLSTKRDTLKELERSWAEKHQALQKEMQKRTQEYVYLKQAREQLVQTIDPALLKEYDHLQKRKQGIAVARLKDDVCDACNTQVPRGIVTAAQDREHLTYCPNCGRILYLG
jgi:hypothetical protein